MKELKRPGKLSLALLCAALALLVALNAALVVLVPPNFDLINSYLAPKAVSEDASACREASADMTRTIESEGIVLLENKNNTLPLKEGTPINIFGYGSRDTVYGGTGSGSGDSSSNVTIPQGFSHAGFQVNTELVSFYDAHFIKRTGVGFTGSNFDINEPPVSEYSDDLIQNAKAHSDVAVFVISRFGGEGADLPMDMDPELVTEIVASGLPVRSQNKGGDKGKHYLELQTTEREVLDMITKNFGTVIVLVNSTNAMELGWLREEGIDAALWIGCLGSTGADAVGEVLCGKVNPSGRTSDTFAYEVESAPSYYSLGDYTYPNIQWKNTSMVGSSSDPDEYHYVDYIEGIYVGYRYYETAAADGFIDYDAVVQYPFGYGLSYTTFEKKIADLRQEEDRIIMDAVVTNTGNLPGKEVVQVWFTAPYTPGGIEKSHVVLADFAKTALLQPGESQTVTLSFTRSDLASYDYLGIKAPGGAYVLEQGDYEIKLMNNAHDLLESRVITVDADVIFNDENAGPRPGDGISAVNLFDFASFGECAAYLSRADWAGTFPQQRMPESRNASETTVAVINSTALPLDGVSAEDIILADHGLKLDDLKGLSYDDPQWDLLLEQIPAEEMKALIQNGGWSTGSVPSVGKPVYVEVDGPNGVNNISNGTTGNQYCAQSVLACTWNTELAFSMGQTFAREALAMNIPALYAPAMNIHRSPFSGRNYEYYSEDGLHSGKMAAAEVRGLQETGVTTYCKHFAVNDQESNRDSGGLLTWVNEQAMREIYFKPFELAVKQGRTRAIMSAFNRIGPVCASECPQLLQTVLRQEWNFRGCVITDCIVQLSYINIDRALQSGNDLMLSIANFNKLTDATTASAAGRQAMRKATRNILYAAANSLGLQLNSTPVPWWLYISVGLADALLCAAWIFFLIRRCRMQRMWKAHCSIAASDQP